MARHHGLRFNFFRKNCSRSKLFACFRGIALVAQSVGFTGCGRSVFMIFIIPPFFFFLAWAYKLSSSLRLENCTKSVYHMMYGQKVSFNVLNLYPMSLVEAFEGQFTREFMALSVNPSSFFLCMQREWPYKELWTLQCFCVPSAVLASWPATAFPQVYIRELANLILGARIKSS